ncbi:peptidoglycan-binding domain-containing protein [Agromyces sp. NPDC004153]
MPIRTRRHKLALAFAALSLAAAGTVGAVGGAPAPAEAAGRCVDYNYSLGGYSSCIGYIQQLLNYHRPYGWTPLVVDNAFGPKTRDLTIRVQQTFGLVADGIVGPRTWNIICYPQKGPGPIPGFPYTAARAAGCAI